MNRDLICHYCGEVTVCDYEEIADDYTPNACEWCGHIFDGTEREFDWEGDY